MANPPQTEQMSQFLSWAEIVVPLLAGALSGFLAAVWKQGRYSHAVEMLEKKVDKMEEDLQIATHKLTECETKINERTTSYASTLTQRKSPISLTQKGQEILMNSGAKKFVLENLQELVGKIKEKNPHTAYDVQVASRQVVESLQNDTRFVPFKNYVYKEGLDLDPIFIVMSLCLRDSALPLLGFKYEQIDQSDPKQVFDPIPKPTPPTT